MFASLVFALATQLAIPVLRQRPRGLRVVVIIVITVGVLFGSGAFRG